MAKKKVSRKGRPKSADPKVHVTFRTPRSHLPHYESKAAELGVRLSDFHRIASDQLAGIDTAPPPAAPPAAPTDDPPAG